MQFGLRRAAPFVSYPIHLLKLVYSCHSYCTKKSVSAVLTQYLCMALMQLCCHLANKREIMAAKEKHCRPRKPHFRLPWRDSWGDGHRTTSRTAVSGTAPALYRYSQVRSTVSEEMRPRQTDRQTDRQTANLISFHYHAVGRTILIIYVQHHTRSEKRLTATRGYYTVFQKKFTPRTFMITV